MGDRMQTGTVLAAHTLTTVRGDRIEVPDGLTHLQFRRFAGCPVCNLHLRSVAARHDEIASAGIREVVVFHSSATELRPFTAELPFAVVGDPDKVLYREFGVAAGRRALADPRAWQAIARGVLRDLGPLLTGRRPAPPPANGGRLGLPADFLIAPDGVLLAAKYGDHADDQWSVDELLTVAHGATDQRV
jgi:peroxiredoxin